MLLVVVGADAEHQVLRNQLTGQRDREPALGIAARVARRCLAGGDRRREVTGLDRIGHGPDLSATGTDRP